MKRTLQAKNINQDVEVENPICFLKVKKSGLTKTEFVLGSKTGRKKEEI